MASDKHFDSGQVELSGEGCSSSRDCSYALDWLCSRLLSDKIKIFGLSLSLPVTSRYVTRCNKNFRSSKGCRAIRDSFHANPLFSRDF